MELKEYLRLKRELINGELVKALEADNNHPLSEIYNYCLLGGGKRFRPILVLSSAEACDLKAEKAIPAALSIELIHNFSLIHDDLPCMDNDMERRGMPTCHAKFGQTDALLAGDALIIFAFGMLARNYDVSEIKPESVIKVVKLFSDAAGHNGMTGGQVLDMKYQNNKDITEEMLIKIHENKTGALIKASVMAGGILAGADSEKMERLSIYGKNIGLTYQIIDDFLDLKEDSEDISFPSLFGKERAFKMAEDATADAIKALDIFGESAEPLRKLAIYLLKREY